MDPLSALSLVNMFFKIIEKGAGAIVPELISLGIPGSQIVIAAEVMGVNLSSNSTVRKDPSLQRYLNIKLDRSVTQSLDRSITRSLDNE